jgi:Trypsin
VGAYQYATIANGAQLKTIAKKVIHPYYNATTSLNDFMILKLNSTVANAAPVQLNRNASRPVPGEQLTILGMGTITDGTYTEPSILQQVTVNYVTYATCNQAWGSIAPTVMLCSSTTNGKDGCTGDGGGPVLDSQGKLVGLVSFGIGCATGYPAINARVTGAIDWIDQKICDLSANKPASCTKNNKGKVPVKIEVTYDRFANETAWTLKGKKGIVVATQASGPANKKFNKTVFVAPGSYIFAMTDIYGDGICCDDGNGSVKVTVNGTKTVVNNNGQFGLGFSKTFTIASNKNSNLRQGGDTTTTTSCTGWRRWFRLRNC